MGDRSGPAWNAARIAGLYLVVSAVWIFGSDWLLGVFVSSPDQITVLQTAKGLLFVTATSGLLFVLVHRQQRDLEQANADLERTLQHAGVLHRVLRHNVRNSCDVILNNAALVHEDRANLSDCCDRIQRQAEQLSGIAEKTEQLRDVVLEEAFYPVDMDLVGVVEDAVQKARADHPEADFTVDAPPSLVVRATPRLGVAVSELLTNAVVHQHTPDTTVTVTVAADGDRGVLRIEDDGGGLPQTEQEVLERGVEHPLSHSQGVGLWLVRFIVQDSNGDVDVSAGERGTAVTIRLPR